LVCGILNKLLLKYGLVIIKWKSSNMFGEETSYVLREINIYFLEKDSFIDFK